MIPQQSTMDALYKTMLSTTSADEKKLTHALAFSALTYFDDVYIQAELTKLNIPYKILSYKGMKCLIGEADEAIYIAFRGTDMALWVNWKRDLNIFPKDFENGLKVHGGFKIYHDEYKTFVKDYIDSINKPKPVIFTGHSLGGAVAALYNISYNKTSSSITFACPNFLYNSPYNEPTSSSYILTNDIVPHIPFSLPFMRWTKACSSKKFMSINHYVSPFGSHRIDNYITSILLQVDNHS